MTPEPAALEARHDPARHDDSHLHDLLEALRREARVVFSGLGEDDPPTYAYARYPRDPAHPDVPLEELPRMVAGYPAGQALPPAMLGSLVARMAEYIYAQAQFARRASRPGADPWRAVFAGPIAPPEPVIAHHADDAEFARQAIQGLNPMVIARLTDPAAVPPALAGLAAQGLTAAELAAAGRLFVLDYRLLAGLPRYRDMVFYAPIALLYREALEGGGARLNLLGFQLERGADAEAFTAAATPPNRYRLARLHLACADNQYHQFVYHLGYAHMAMEPLAIAHHNAFPPDHPVGELLAPHLRGTIGINTLARHTLVSPILPLTDRTFSLGSAGALRLFLAAYREWDFFGQSFPAQLAARGFDEAGSDGLPGFRYRDDGFRVWRAVEAYVADVVAAIYPDDAAVAADPVLQAWAAESVDPDRAAIRGFPARFGSRELLAQALTTIIFTCSAQHAAVNLPQYDYLSYLPNRPDSLYRGMPEGRGEIDQATLAAAMPGLKTLQFQVMVAHMLATPSAHVLGDLDGARARFPALHAKHAARMAALSADLAARDEADRAAGRMPYPYLRPDRIGATNDI